MIENERQSQQSWNGWCPCAKFRRAGEGDFFIGGDLNIDLKLDNADDEHQGLDSIEWYGMYGPKCKGSREDTIADENIEVIPEIAGLQLHR